MDSSPKGAVSVSAPAHMPLPSLARSRSRSPSPSKAVLPPDTLRASPRGLRDGVILTLTGRLDIRNPLIAGQCAEHVFGQIDACFAERPRSVVVDLCATEPTRFVVALLALVRRRAERSAVPLALAATTAGRDFLEKAQVASLYAIHPSLDSALESLAPRPTRTGRRS